MFAHKKAFDRWFSEYEAARRKAKIRPGRPVPGLPAAPIHPDDVRQVIDRLGRSLVLATLGIHRSTLERWERGRAVIPRAAWLVLMMIDAGRLPGMSADWSDFRFDGDALTIPGTRWRYTARELQGIPYLAAQIAALERQTVTLERKIAHLLRVGDFGAANDALSSVREA